MRRNGSILATLAVALVATIGVVGGGYTIVTGNTLCSLVGACDTTAAAPAATPVALTNSDSSGCTAEQIAACAVTNPDCAKACESAKAVADASTCSKSGAQAIAVNDNADCATKCSDAKAVAVGDNATCSKSGAQAVAVASYECKADSMFCEESMTKRASLHESLLPKIQNVSELSNGYAMDFPACSKTLVEVAEMVALSRECCDFLSYDIVADANGGPVHLVMTGDAGAKAFLAKALGTMVTQVSDSGSCGAAQGATVVAASDTACADACEAKAGKVNAVNTGNAVVTKISIYDACCEKGVKAVKAGLNMPACCTENAANKGADLE